MVETCDSDIFMTIPCLAVLRGLINEEENGVCRRFLPSMTKDGEENHKKAMELRAEFLKLRAKVCGSNTEFIIRTTSSHLRQRSNSRDASASALNSQKPTVASSI